MEIQGSTDSEIVDQTSGEGEFIIERIVFSIKIRVNQRCIIRNYACAHSHEQNRSIDSVGIIVTQEKIYGRDKDITMYVMVHERGLIITVSIWVGSVNVKVMEISQTRMWAVDKAMSLVDIIRQSQCDVMGDPFANAEVTSKGRAVQFGIVSIGISV